VSTSPPPIIVSGGGSAPPQVAHEPGRTDVLRVVLVMAVAVLLQITFMPYIRVADGIPDLLACAVVAVALLRGSTVGALAGAAGGLAVELTAPIGTMGVLALIYMAVGAACGRYADREESEGILPPVVLAVAAAAFAQLAYLVVQVLLGAPIFAGEFTARVLVPTLALTALVAAPVLLIVRRVLGAHRRRPAYLMAGDA
jgi:rod shape-determining protein MreD